MQAQATLHRMKTGHLLFEQQVLEAALLLDVVYGRFELVVQVIALFL
jgi:hypothetical protein